MTGDKRIITKLIREFPDRLKQTIINILYEISHQAATAAIPLAPIKHGHLRRSIRAEVDPRLLRAAVVAGNAQVNYAIYQEFGTYDQKIDPNNLTAILSAMRGGLGVRAVKGRKGIAPKLFVHRGVYNSISRMEVIITDHLSKLEKAIS